MNLGRIDCRHIYFLRIIVLFKCYQSSIFDLFLIVQHLFMDHTFQGMTSVSEIRNSHKKSQQGEVQEIYISTFKT